MMQQEVVDAVSRGVVRVIPTNPPACIGQLDRLEFDVGLSKNYGRV
jgi:hypothetical protein